MDSAAAIRASPYEQGLYFVSPEPGTTLQSIGTTEWKVGPRYTLQKVLGYGSFSCVCLATDIETGEQVALKRIGDVLHSAEQAKRVLREVAILRRTSHPNLIGLRDCFVRPSSTGQCRMVNGRLVHCSIDVYLAMEYADGGDLFHMRGQLAPEGVTSLLWQLLHAVQYLHKMHVWHRDVKSQNAFIHWERGVRVVKLGDFGSARSALLFDSCVDGDGGGAVVSRKVLCTDRSYQEMEDAMRTDDLYAQPAGTPFTQTTPPPEVMKKIEKDEDDDGSDPSETKSPSTMTQAPSPFSKSSPLPLPSPSSSSAAAVALGFKAPLTRVVATPCYRAPEVVMSRGGYSSALDTWGIGCIFGELLQRVAYVGSADTPNLSVAPLFALRCMPKTPDGGETFFGSPECAGTRRELQALFDVLGTPSWRDAAAVEMPEWRIYLERLPGKAPTLYRRFKLAGEVPLHLLSRLLDFDPVGRACCDEALAHEFFAGLREELGVGVSGGAVGISTEMRNDEILDDDEMPFEGVGSEALEVDAAAAAATRAALLSNTSLSQNQHQTRDDETMQDNDDEEEPLPPPPPPQAATTTTTTVAEDWNNPGKALGLLEEQVTVLSESASPEGLLDPWSPGNQQLRLLLEAECEAAAAEAAVRRDARQRDIEVRRKQQEEQQKTAAAATRGKEESGDGGKGRKQQRRVGFEQRRHDDDVLEGWLRRGCVASAGGFQEDAAAASLGRDSDAQYGMQRLSNIADTWQGKELDPGKYLGSNRHGEWTDQGVGGGPAPGPRWGVATVVPGMDAKDPRVQAIISAMQGR